MSLQPSKRTGYLMLQNVKLVMLGPNIIPELVKGYKDFTEQKIFCGHPTISKRLSCISWQG